MPDNPKPEEVLAALREIEGVDEKLLKRPEVLHLPSVLEKGELPGCIATNGRPSMAGSGTLFATDRRIIYIEKSSWSSSIKKVETYPYADIQRIEAGESVWAPPLEVQTTNPEKTISMDADKDWRFRFAEYVSSKLSTNPVFEALRDLEGIDDGVLKRPEVLHLPTVLEEGELPGHVASHEKSMAFVTDRRIITIKQTLLTDAIAEVETYPLDEIQWIKAIEGIIGAAVFFLIAGKETKVSVDKGSASAFADYISSRIPPNPAVEALRDLDSIDQEFLGQAEVAYLASVLEKGELPEFATYASSSVRKFFATDRRIIFIQLETTNYSVKEVGYFPYAEIESVELRENVLLKPVLLKIAGRKDLSVTGDMKMKKAFADFVNAKINSL